MICASSREAETDIAFIIDSEERKIVLTTKQSAPPVAGSRLGQQYLKMYDEAKTSSSKPIKETTNQFTKQPVEMQKELWYAKALQKDKEEGSSTLICFDVLAQLANILAKFTLYELLRLSKSIREAIREVLADSEAFIAQIPAGHDEEDEENCLQTFKHFPCITFTPDDMQIKVKHDRFLYYT